MTCDVTYDVLGNERHKAVCELRKLSTCSMGAHGFRDGLAAAIGVSKEGAPYDDGTLCKLISERLIHLLGGGVEPVALRELFGILKEGDGGVDAGRRVETGDGRSDASADGHLADSAGSQVSEGVAPITTELRAAMDVDRESIRADGTVVAQTFCVDRDDFNRLCDAIDAVHAQLERDYKVACEVNERQDEQYVDMVHRLDRAYEKNRNQRKQLTEVQEALHRRNEGELKDRWQKELDRLERENEDLRRQLESLMLDSRPMTDENMAEHGWVRLPVDADGVPINAGDVLDGYGKTIEVVEMRYGRSGWVLISRDGNGYADTFAFTHHHAPTVEDVLTEFGIDWEHESDCEDRAALLAEYAAKLRLAGDAE